MNKKKGSLKKTRKNGFFCLFFGIFCTFFSVTLVLFEQIVLKFEKIKLLEIRYVEKWVSPEIFFGLRKSAFGLTFGPPLKC